MREQKVGFVPNANYRAFLEGYAILKARGERAASLMLVTGTPGIGKTTVVDKFAIESNAVYLRARVTHTMRSLIDDLAAQMPGVATKGSTSAIQASIIKNMTKHPRPIIVDEIQNLIVEKSNSIRKLECLRDISDLSGCELIMVAGQNDVEGLIAEHDQIDRRISARVKFQPASVEDIQVLLDKLAHTRIKPDLTADLHAKARGRLGPICNAIPAIDAYAETNGKEELCLADVKGIEIIFGVNEVRRGKQ